MAQKNFKRIFAGIFLIWFALVIFAAAFYWPQIKQSFSTLMNPDVLSGARPKNVPAAASVGNKQVRGARVQAASGAGDRKEGFLWAEGQYIVTLGEAHGAVPGKNLLVYDGTNELGEVTVERALETVSYVRPVKASLDFSRNPDGFYRVVMK